MIGSGAQIKAARALINWTQSDLATAAGLHANAVAYWEAKPAITSRHHAGSGPRRISEALAAKGVAFISEPGPGVCFVQAGRCPPKAEVAEQFAEAFPFAAHSSSAERATECEGARAA